MIKKNPTWKIVLAFLLAFGLWSFTLFNTGLFGSVDRLESFDLVYYIIALACCIPIFLLGAIRIELGKKTYLAVSITAYVFAIVGSMAVSVLFCDGFLSTPYIFFVNTAFYLLVAALALVASGSMRVSALTAIVVSYIFNIAIFIVYCLRGTALSPTDIYGVGTAMNVAAQYSFMMKYQIITATIVTIALVMLVSKFPVRIKKFRLRPLVIRLAGAATAAACAAFILSVNVNDFDISAFDQYYANLNFGSAFGFYANATKMGLQKHDTYDTEYLNYLLSAYEQDRSVPADKPNVVVIMNESFSDLSVVGEFDTNIPYLQFTNTLSRNTQKGQLMVSPFGGITCNSEYEFLTGMNVGVLSPGAMPYMQMMFDNVPYSMVSHMKAMGYHTTAFHPYPKNGWNRENVYKYFGFDEYIGSDEMGEYNSNQSYLRDYLSDISDYDTVLNYLRSDDPGTRQFIFNVTIQNHGGYQYPYPYFKDDVTLSGMNGSYPQTEQYLTLMKNSDDALRYFIGELKKLDEPTIILLFGDHQPGIEREFYEELYGKPLEQLTSEELSRRYFVPFIIWANYDIDKEDDIHTSPCFLGGKLLDAAGLPKSRVQMYLDDVQSIVRQLNPLGWYEADGTWHYLPKTAALDNYYNLQYAILTNETLNYDFDYSAAEGENPSEAPTEVTAEEIVEENTEATEVPTEQE